MTYLAETMVCRLSLMIIWRFGRLVALADGIDSFETLGMDGLWARRMEDSVSRRLPKTHWLMIIGMIGSIYQYHY